MAFSDGPIAAIDRRKEAMLALCKNWAGELVAYAKSNKPWTDRTGHTTQRLHGGVDEKGSELEIYLAHGQESGEYLERGTGTFGPFNRSFTIAPKNKKALFWPGARHPIKKPINHPGMKPKSIIIPTLEAHIGRIKATIRELWS